uniref:AMP-dependent synthetase/ligase domain-containing protein n=1 Tax=Panagrolaimus sp. PS1159 TaxID=55785 RepID=A0AC35F488_9BILA
MPLRIGKEAVFCLDFTLEKQKDFSPFEATIPELIYRKCASEKIAFAFDAEKVGITFGKIKAEMEAFAAGLLSFGLKQNDRILICGYNLSQVLITALGCSRAGLIFALANPNFGTNSDPLKHLLEIGGFKAVILFAHSNNVDLPHNLIAEICPELRSSNRGKLASAALPLLTHVILADEDHKHSGTYTLSEIYSRSNKERLEKLPNYAQWNSHRLAAIGFTMGSTGLPKAVGLTHYQCVNGCRLAAAAIGITSETILCCALPLFRLPVFCLVALTPFLMESKTIFSEPSPIPRGLFTSIKKYQCTTILSNAAALRLGLRTVFTHKIILPSVETVILLGERVNAELLTAVDRVMPNAKGIAVGMLLAETGAIPVLSDNKTNLIKSVGRVLDGYEIEIAEIKKLSNSNRKIGEMRIRPLLNTKFVGYGPEFNSWKDFIETGDIVSQTNDGNIEIICHREDLIYDRNDHLVEHWKMERLMATYVGIKGVQVLQVCHGAPVLAVVIPTSLDCVPEFLKTDLSTLCRNNNLYAPEKIAVIDEFPRVNTKIQKYKLRQLIRADLLALY